MNERYEIRTVVATLVASVASTLLLVIAAITIGSPFARFMWSLVLLKALVIVSVLSTALGVLVLFRGKVRFSLVASVVSIVAMLYGGSFLGILERDHVRMLRIQAAAAKLCVEHPRDVDEAAGKLLAIPETLFKIRCDRPFPVVYFLSVGGLWIYLPEKGDYEYAGD